MVTATRKKASPAAELTLTTLPAIGTAFAGGKFAGLSIHDNKPVGLVLLPGDEKLPWDAARAWAEKQGGELPSRIDVLVLFQNLKDDFKRDWYWTGQPYAGDESYAWCQHFRSGYQGSSHKGYELRARAVRRVPIQ